MLTRFLRKIGIRWRLFSAVLLIAVLSTGTMALFAAHNTRAYMSAQADAFSAYYLETLAERLTKTLSTYAALMEQTIFSPRVRKAIQSFDSMNTLEHYNMRVADGQEAVRLFNQLDELAYLSIMNTTGDMIFSSGYRLVAEQEVAFLLERFQGITYEGICFWHDDSILFAKPIQYYPNEPVRGYFLIMLKPSAFSRQFNADKLEKDAIVVVSDIFDEIISAQGLPSGDYAQALSVLSAAPDAPIFIEEKKMSTAQFTGHHFELTAFYPNHAMEQAMATLWQKLALLALPLAAAALLTANAITRSVTRPLKDLQAFVADSLTQNFSLQLQDTGRDELHEIGAAFAVIVEQIKEMLQTISEKEAAKLQLEIQMLQAQINPHFLFNTLGSLRMTALANGQQMLSDSILALCELLRGTIIDKNRTISLQEELRSLEHYAVIQRLRYGDSFALQFDIDASLTAQPILKFLLQPIVENAILHGTRDDGQLLHITISARRHAQSMIIEIHDDGKGFDTHKPANPNHRLSGIGMSNVADRIRLTYGGESKFEIQSKVGDFTRVTMTLPLKGLDEYVSSVNR